MALRIPKQDERARRARWQVRRPPPGGTLVAADDRHADCLGEAGIRVRRKIVTEAHPDPAHAIVQEARGGDYDVVVIGRHGRGRVGEWLFSSVADEVADELGSARVAAVD